LTPDLQGGWTESVLYRFKGRSDGENPLFGDLVFDQAGNLYGTTYFGGRGRNCSGNCGVIYELSPSNGGWKEGVLYAFQGGEDGYEPYSGVIFDKSGNLYGTTTQGGDPGGGFCGTVYQLTPTDSGWTHKVIYSFHNGSDGACPYGGLIMDQSGNLYGTTACGGGTVFMLSPSNGNWIFTLLYDLPYSSGGPSGSLVMDAGGNLYGTTMGGTIFKLARSDSGWAYTDLHDFSNLSDGYVPKGGLIFDSNGNLYGTTYRGGGCDLYYGCGVVFEITP
jgi:uncharacterized repeat protein (TIGR03803 family)